jgi:hypothetical protein
VGRARERPKKADAAMIVLEEKYIFETSRMKCEIRSSEVLAVIKRKIIKYVIG